MTIQLMATPCVRSACSPKVLKEMMGMVGRAPILIFELLYPLAKMLQRGLGGISFHLQYGGVPPENKRREK